MDEPSFSELVERARRGDPEAAQLLIERYEPAIRRQVRFALMDNRLKQVLEETDICQSIMAQFFVGLWAGQLEFDGPERLIGLLKEMVRNKITDKARYWKARRRDHRRSIGPLDPALEPASPDPTPSRVIADAELLAEFERRLPDRERAILIRRRQGMNWVEIAQHTGGTPESVRKRFERAVARVVREIGLDE
jgi:RNA polymerase sigma factor (sigma-70 family)